MNQISRSRVDTILKTQQKFEIISIQYIVIKKKYLDLEEISIAQSTNQVIDYQAFNHPSFV